MAKQTTVQWLDTPEKHDYPAAESYLGLLVEQRVAKQLAAKLKRASVVKFKAKDVFRASTLPLLPLTNSHVKVDERKILKGHALSPLLLVRDRANGKTVIADGYHRLCAVYAFDEDAVVPCKIV
jgi:hypothetical protein